MTKPAQVLECYMLNMKWSIVGIVVADNRLTSAWQDSSHYTQSLKDKKHNFKEKTRKHHAHTLIRSFGEAGHNLHTPKNVLNA